MGAARPHPRLDGHLLLCPDASHRRWRILFHLFFSTCHGAGRVMSRHQAACPITGPQLRQRLQHQGIVVCGASARGLAEETPEAYKDVTQVVAAAEGAGLCRSVARLVPLGVVKG